MSARRAGWAAVVVAAVLGASCSSSDDPGAGSPASPAPGTDPAAASGPPGTEGSVAIGRTDGLTDGTIAIAFMVPAFGGLVEAGLAPDLGDPEAQIRAYVEHLNAEGGVGGRRIVATFHTFDATDASTVQPACLEATQDNDPFIVVGQAALPPLGVQCVTVENETLMLDVNLDPPQSLLDGSDGRLLSLGMSTDRSFRAWAEILDARGELDGATVGIVRDDEPFLVEAIDGALVPALAELGHEPAEVIALPCPTPVCEQHETAIERLRGAGVDTVFLALPALGGPTFVATAGAVGFESRWTLTNRSINTTVARFYESAGTAFDGALGVGLSFIANPGEDTPRTEAELECNRVYAEASGIEHGPNSDAFGFTALGCRALDLVRRVAERAESDFGGLGQRSFIAAAETVHDIELGSGLVGDEYLGSWGPGKHDAWNHMLVRVFDAEELFWVRPPDSEPVLVP
jgi:hypothetical protein